jgi:uncharacterized protein
MSYRTPGVFVEEVTLLPPSVAAVATAIPGFVGHTARAVDPAGDSLINRPIRITSLLDFTELFGGGYEPASYTVRVDPAAGPDILSVTPVDGRRYYLFDALRHYFDNGGGPCHIVSVGDYAADVIYGTETTGLRGGLRALAKEDEPTILAVPDSVALRQPDGTPDFTQAGNLHKDIVGQCARLQDRFGLLDLVEGSRPPDDAIQPLEQFRNQVGTESLRYGAAYYPWLLTTYLKDVRFGQLAFVDDQAVPVPIPDATIDTLTGDAELDGLVAAMRTRVDEEVRVFSKITEVVLNRTSYDPLSARFEELVGQVMAATTAAAARPAFSSLVSFVRQLALAFQDLADDAGNPPELDLLLESLAADAALAADISQLIAFEKNAGVMNSIATTRAEADVNTDYDDLDQEDWVGGVTTASIAADATDFSAGGTNSVAQTAHAAAGSSILRTAFDGIAQAYASVVQDALFRTDQAESNLFARHPFFRAVLDRVRKEMSLLPPSGAVAGVYASTDRSRGVWKAPANVSLRSVIGPAYKLTDREQGALNVHDTGKSINAIRPSRARGSSSGAPARWPATTTSGATSTSGASSSSSRSPQEGRPSRSSSSRTTRTPGSASAP